MHRWQVVLALAIAVSAARAQPVLVLEHVDVVPMHEEVVWRDQTIVAVDGVITAVGAAGEVAVPAGARRPEVAGAFVLPGLCDLHVHLAHERDLLLYIAHGVTTVRNMWGGPDTLALRETIAAGDRLGPSIVTTGPIMDGAGGRWPGSGVLRDAAAARRAVEAQRAAGYDAFKVYDALSADVYAAIVDQARAVGLPVVGHVPNAVGLAGVLDAGQASIEHLRGYRDAAPEDWPALAARTVQRGVWNCVTLVVDELPWSALRDLDAARQRPAVQWVAPSVRATWDPQRDVRFAGHRTMTPALWAGHRARMARLRAITKLLHDAGAGLLLGTDAPNPFVVPGASAHQELALLVDAGLSPYAALRTGTVAAAAFLGRADRQGTVAVGQVADLLLLRASPLADIAHTRDRVGVVVRGDYLAATELRDRLDRLRRADAEEPDWFATLPPLPAGERLDYVVTWNDQPIGAERFALRRAGSVPVALHAQWAMQGRAGITRVAGQCLPGRHPRLYLEVRGAGPVRAGPVRGRLRVTTDADHLRAHGVLGGNPIEAIEPAGSDVQLATGILAHAMLLAPSLADLTVGEARTIDLRTPEVEGVFELSRVLLRVERRRDSTRRLLREAVPVRVLALRLDLGGHQTRGTLTLDRQHLPVTLELVFPQGHKVFRRHQR
ncbi:MAG: amidohydrolase family protein [Planctomycetota bacterium]